jgi:hypothetical protein
MKKKRDSQDFYEKKSSKEFIILQRLFQTKLNTEVPA